jgi:hypothetical protein
VGKMTKDEYVAFIMDSINQDNIEICQRGGMSEEDIKKSVSDSQQSLNFIVSNLYDRMKVKGLVS